MHPLHSTADSPPSDQPHADPALAQPADGWQTHPATCQLSYSVPAAVERLQRGEVVALPTETVYGLAGDAFNPLALARIFAAKERPTFDPLIVHLLDLSWLSRVALVYDERIAPLARAFWPGPLTLVLPRTSAVPDLVTAGQASVAVRIPRHPVFRAVLAAFDQPLAAPSANRFGCLSPTTSAHVLAQLAGRIPLVLEGGACEIGVESTIVDLTQTPSRLLRPGGLSLEDLRAVLPEIELGVAVLDRPHVPGQLAQHYAPRTPLRLWDGQTPLPEGVRRAVVALDTRDLSRTFAGPETEFVSLDTAGNLTAAASQFFSVLHRLDAAGLGEIRAILLPETGLGVAMNDRLRRAVASFD